MGSKLGKASWIVLTVVGALVLLASCVSTYLAYRGDYPIGGVPVGEVAPGRPGLTAALRAIRGTSAAYAAGFAVFFLRTVLGPYRRGEKSAWWTICLATAVVVAIILLRVPLLGPEMGQVGAGAGLTLGGLVLLGLLLGLDRLQSPS
jgi:hypothetical protein